MSYIRVKKISNFLQNKMYFNMLMFKHNYTGKLEAVGCLQLCIDRLTTNVTVMNVDTFSARQFHEQHSQSLTGFSKGANNFCKVLNKTKVHTSLNLHNTVHPKPQERERVLQVPTTPTVYNL